MMRARCVGHYRNVSNDTSMGGVANPKKRTNRMSSIEHQSHSTVADCLLVISTAERVKIHDRVDGIVPT